MSAARKAHLKDQRALLAKVRGAPVIPMPVIRSAVEVIVLPELHFPLRWKSWNECALCGLMGKMTVDHIRPKSRGGWDCPSNRQPLCSWCNVVKANEVVECVQQYERILVESLGRQGRAHLLPTRPVNTV